jgi:hypothetical protein
MVVKYRQCSSNLGYVYTERVQFSVMPFWKLVGTNEVSTRRLKTLSVINPGVHSNFGITNENITTVRLTLVVGTKTEHHLLLEGSMANTLMVALVLHT